MFDYKIITENEYILIFTYLKDIEINVYNKCYKLSIYSNNQNYLIYMDNDKIFQIYNSEYNIDNEVINKFKQYICNYQFKIYKSKYHHHKDWVIKEYLNNQL